MLNMEAMQKEHQMVQSKRIALGKKYSCAIGEDFFFFLKKLLN